MTLTFPEFLLMLLLAAAMVWAGIRITIWIIKTAVKEALREYNAEKAGGHEGN